MATKFMKIPLAKKYSGIQLAFELSNVNCDDNRRKASLTALIH